MEKVLRVMNLRRPQRESLEKVHQFVLRLDRDLRELDRDELLARAREQYPTWTFAGGFPEMTFALATGVGKTRLMGAIMAYLYLGRQSRNFLLLASRAAILRKLEDECRPGSSKYVFVDPALVPEPRIWHRGNIESFDPTPDEEHLERGPTIAILSPQSLTGEDRRAARPSEFSGTSIVSHLRSIRDLVVTMDEAHHLGKIAERETQAWTQAIRDLAPRLQFGMTATPRYEEGVNVLHAYDLRTCLREKLYTKDVRVIVRQMTQGDRVTDEEWDRHTLDFALDRLQRKEAAIEAYRGEHTFPSIRPVLLVCAESTAHAEELATWLKTHRGLGEDEVLVTHSERAKTEEDIARLVGIERPDSHIRVVVNVYELTEGWDVTNVYVIAPLRKMGTFQGAVQTMGRGLRLPAGRRVDDEELDTLDLLCFGRESLQEVLDAALAQYGDEEDKESPVRVQDAGEHELSRELLAKVVQISPVRSVRIEMHRAVRRPLEPDLDFDVSTIRRVAERSAVEFDLSRGDVSATAESLKYEFDVFVRLAAGRVITALRYLSEPLHRSAVERLVATFLEGIGRKPDEPVILDWVQVAEVIKDEIDRPYRKKEATFDVLAERDTVQFGAFPWRVPASFVASLDVSGLAGWDSGYYRLPVTGWKRCVHEAAAFDTGAEFLLARILDHDRDIEWWIRNDPPRLRIPTPIGYYEPDFLVRRVTNGGPVLTIIEVKGADFWEPPDSDPRVKARATGGWCEAVNRAGREDRWEYWVVLDADVERASSVEDLRRFRVNDEGAQAQEAGDGPTDARS